MSGSGTYASPPCMAAEVDSARFDPQGVDPVRACNVKRWRRAERIRLAALREELGQSGRAQTAEAIAGHLGTYLAAHGAQAGAVVAGYWPIRGEPDLRPLLSRLHEAGVTFALPVVETLAAPLVFRRWTPRMRMERGHWNIAVPPAAAETVIPGLVLAPCLGWDGGCFRLGWGGGYFDRTLAALAPQPFAIGVALAAARLSTIYPQPHDVPMDAIVTEKGVAAERTDET